MVKGKKKVEGKKEKKESSKSILVFISYATADANAFKIAEIAEGLTAFPEIADVLYWQEDLHDDIWTYMDKNVGKCDVFVYFCSPNARKSKPCEKEWHAADALNKPIIPVFSLLEYIPPLLRPRLGLQIDVFNIEENVKKLRELILKKYIPKEDLTIPLRLTHKNKSKIIHAKKDDHFISPIIEFCMQNNLSIKNILVTTTGGERVPDTQFDETISAVYSKYGKEFTIQIEKMQIVANFKVCLVGDAASGKSALLKHCIEATYDDVYTPTVGVDYWVKPFDLQTKDKHFDIVLLFWDFGGSFEDAGEKKELLNESDGIFVIGDLTRKETFTRIQTGCVPKLHKVLGEEIPIILLANKSDLKLAITKEEVEEIAKSLGIKKVFFTSAKTGKNVEAGFKSIIPPMVARALDVL
ncbi:MAG: GTP-binding protein [Candidatus Helarchaeota archaeon]|nr:GTP-binding protein [Candidatus Helarchaeota archaeon]